ncbi:hypothetical protein HBH64_122290 [Parastagonospora nodorum]|nr:hypothetical protein HBI01_197200 [Parastagonospora nodorum]KAH4317902.1 hypothetical protein HBI02_017760 [Parastagonospora nodorum]KAH4326949.1 hypothetical protein HBI00_134250 [Parastagonospora nodorum]KAH4393285.1 hypothetical protein HBH94_009810 [Parastagonospora nodorum]KAH4476973.1 hypothetical protein HBH90_002870 [Parastagonospora nodorum]
MPQNPTLYSPTLDKNTPYPRHLSRLKLLAAASIRHRQNTNRPNTTPLSPNQPTTRLAYRIRQPPRLAWIHNAHAPRNASHDLPLLQLGELYDFGDEVVRLVFRARRLGVGVDSEAGGEEVRVVGS